MESVILAFVSAVVVALVATPMTMRLAARVGAIDLPNERKAHQNPTPRLGGIAVVASWLAALGVLWAVDPALIAQTWLSRLEGQLLLVALLGVVAVGIADDIRNLRPLEKFLGQVAMALIAYFAGFSVNAAAMFGGGIVSARILDLPLTVLWIVGVTNAINLIDGLDGLAAGVALIATLTMAPIALLQNDVGSSILTVVLAGSLLGFLRYNFNPARIFLGDSGSLFLGFILAVLSVKSSTKISTGFALLMPILALGLPIMDTLLSMVRRFLRSFLPENGTSWRFAHTLKSMFLPDRAHIHHRLISRGMSTRGAVFALYSVSVFLGAGAFAITVVNNHTASLILLTMGGAIIVGFRQLHYREMAVLKNGVLLPLYDRPIMNRESFQSFFDLAFILGAFAAASALVDGGSRVTLPLSEFLRRIAIAGAIQLAVFLAMGHQKRTYQFYGLGDMMRAVRTLVMAVVVTGMAFKYMGPVFRYEDMLILIYDMFFLLVLVLGMSLSYRVLRYISRRQPSAGPSVLLYGADSVGSLVLDKILTADVDSWRPVGFIDDNPMLEGRYLNGFQILGGHWSLHHILRKHQVSEIVLCSENLQPEAVRRVHEIAKEHRINVKRIRILYEDFHPQEAVVSPLHADVAGMRGRAPGMSGRKLPVWPLRDPVTVNPVRPEQ